LPYSMMIRKIMMYGYTRIEQFNYELGRKSQI